MTANVVYENALDGRECGTAYFVERFMWENHARPYTNLITNFAVIYIPVYSESVRA